MLQSSLQQLKMAQTRFVESSESINKLNSDNEGR